MVTETEATDIFTALFKMRPKTPLFSLLSLLLANPHRHPSRSDFTGGGAPHFRGRRRQRANQFLAAPRHGAAQLRSDLYERAVIDGNLPQDGLIGHLIRRIHRVSKKLCKIVLSEIRQISTKFDKFWQKDDKEAEII